MALIASHIRFALGLMHKYQVTDIKKYLSGSIYPDSRYLTAISRSLTHPQNFLGNFSFTDDFRKGWFTHLLCDKFQIEIIKEKLPDFFSKDDSDIVHGSELWIHLTAFKCLEKAEHFQRSAFKENCLSS